jgi:methyltransferase family protein
VNGAPTAAVAALGGLEPREQLAVVVRRLRGEPGGPLAAFDPRDEATPGGGPARIDGRLLEALAEGALGGAHGAVFTPGAEARLLAAFGLAHAAARRGGPAPGEAVALLLGTGSASEAGLGDGLARRDTLGATPAAAQRLAAALDGLTVLDPACGGGALLAAAEKLARGVGARLALIGLDRAPLAVEAARARLELLGARAEVRRADALSPAWPRCDLLLANPPFLRHEAIPPAQKAAAARLSGLSRQADLSAHLARLALRRAPVAALVLPRALLTARSAAPLLEEARARGGLALKLRSRAAGSFAASVDTLLAVWVEGGPEAPGVEAEVALEALSDAEVVALARALWGEAPAGTGGRRGPPAAPLAGERLRLERPAARAGARRRGDAPPPLPLGDLCQVRFGLKTGCNAFFHLLPLGGGRYRSALLGEVALADGDVAPLLSGLREAPAPERLVPRFVIFRPAGEPSALGRRYLAAGERAGVHRRATCAARRPWWRVVPGRGPAPLLYPAKVGARAFAVVNGGGLLEDKKWHALFPRGVEPWALALVLSATPVRLRIDEGARQLTGAQAIADVDCHVLAGAPVPAPAALAGLLRELATLRAALAGDEVTTDLAAMLARPAQRRLDLLVGRALGLSAREVEASRAALLDRVGARLAHAAAVRRKL